MNGVDHRDSNVAKGDCAPLVKADDRQPSLSSSQPIKSYWPTKERSTLETGAPHPPYDQNAHASGGYAWHLSQLPDADLLEEPDFP